MASLEASPRCPWYIRDEVRQRRKEWRKKGRRGFRFWEESRLLEHPAWKHFIGIADFGSGSDSAIVLDPRFDPAPLLYPVWERIEPRSGDIRLEATWQPLLPSFDAFADAFGLRSWIGSDEASSTRAMIVGDRTVPTALAAAIRSGEWERLADSPHIDAVFRVEPFGRPSFPSLKALGRLNLEWWWTDDDYLPGYYGKGEHQLKPAESLLIGDRHVGGEFLIALDYRTNPPCVRVLGRGEHWTLVTDTVEELLDRLRW